MAKSFQTEFVDYYKDKLATKGFVKVKGRQPYFVRVVNDEILHVITYLNRPSTEIKFKKAFELACGVATVYKKEIDFSVSSKKGDFIMDLPNVTILEHPLIQHKISMLRDERTGTNEFRKLVEEIATLMGYEALRDLPLEDVEIKTPIETCMTPMIAGKKLAIVPILRAGLGMVNGILSLVPTAKVGHIGLCRDEETHEAKEYYCKLPSPIDKRTIVVLDPMLATGGSAVSAVNFIKERGGRDIKFMCIIAAPDGVEKLMTAHPDVKLYVGHLDRCLNENAYICPGLGDAGDRIFGTR